jgi:hypothetical protein
MTDSKRLLGVFRALSAERRQALLEYAEFLLTKEEALPAVASEPLPIPRPQEESVVKAIRRLMQTYPMLERNRIFHEASAQMTRHLLHGIPAADTIDELERIFERHYRESLTSPEQMTSG